jgi:hypothetical protein
MKRKHNLKLSLTHTYIYQRRSIMKYSKYLFVLVALFGLFFYGCQGTEQVNSPVDSLIKGADWGTPPTTLGDLDGGPKEVELIAGQFYKVGMVKVEKYDGGLKVTYNITVANGYMTEIHLDLASTANDNAITGFHVNKQMSPRFGHFDRNISLSNVTSKEVIFTFEQLKTALGVTTLNDNTPFYIAAHAVVCFPMPGTGTTVNGICPEWASSNQMLTLLAGDANWTMDKSPYPIRLNLDGTLTDFVGYCANPYKGTIAINTPTLFEFVCLDGSYTWPEGCLAFEYYEYFDALNYFLNLPLPAYAPVNGGINGVANSFNINGNMYTIGKKDAQFIVWALLWNIDPTTFNGGIGGPNNPGMFPAIINDIKAAGEGFIPGCDQFVGVLAFDNSASRSVCDAPLSQPFLLRVPVECQGEMQCETAMGFRANYNSSINKWIADPAYSNLFPGSQWFRYFTVTW